MNLSESKKLKKTAKKQDIVHGKLSCHMTVNGIVFHVDIT